MNAKFSVLEPPKLAMTIGGGYPPAAALPHVREIVANAPGVARSVLKQCRSAGLETPILPRLVEELEKRCNTLRRDYP